MKNKDAESKFGLLNYWRMYKARGVRLPIAYFLQAHFFDILHGTDTHRWLKHGDYLYEPANFEHGYIYMCSWTNELKKNFNRTKYLLGNDFASYNFLDIGCGKGKSVLVWRQLLKKYKLEQTTIGIEYYSPLVDIARINYMRLFGNPGNFLVCDATKIDMSQFGDKLIVYMYNPFDAVVLTHFLRRLQNIPAIIIYNNPVYFNTLVLHGFNLIFSSTGFHPNSESMIFSNHNFDYSLV